VPTNQSGKYQLPVHGSGGPRPGGEPYANEGSTGLKLTDFEALSFDCYGTLIDWEAGIAAVLAPWAKRCGLDLDQERLLEAYAAAEAEAELRHPRNRYPSILARSFRSLGANLGAPVSEEDAAALASSVPGWPAFEDSHDALVVLRKRFQLIILSNVDRVSFAGSQARLRVEFTSVLTAEEIGAYKPSPRNFEALTAEAGRLGVAQGKLLHVAQSLFHDHAPAKRAGLPTVWINRRHGRPGWGATPAPSAEVVPDWEFLSMAAFASAVEHE
jgi:putative hydrolase of the HAD superfamily